MSGPILYALLAWAAASFPVGVLVGKFIAVGRGPGDEG